MTKELGSYRANLLPFNKSYLFFSLSREGEPQGKRQRMVVMVLGDIRGVLSDKDKQSQGKHMNDVLLVSMPLEKFSVRFGQRVRESHREH